MALGSVFRTTVSTADPTSGHLGIQPPANTAAPSDFITVQSLANFAVMTGAITAAWGGVGSLAGVFHGRWFPFVLCLVFGLISLLTAVSPAQPEGGANNGWFGASLKKWGPPSFIALVNALVLYSAVLGAGAATTLTS